MYTARPYPGKFEANRSQLVARVVYDISCDGLGESLGDVEGFGFYDYIEGKRYGFILENDSQGFVTVMAYPKTQAQAKWAQIEEEYEAFCEIYETE